MEPVVVGVVAAVGVVAVADVDVARCFAVAVSGSNGEDSNGGDGSNCWRDGAVGDWSKCGL